MARWCWPIRKRKACTKRWPKEGTACVFAHGGSFFNAPVVDEVDLSGYSGQVGETILVPAHDDFQVTEVTLARTDGTAIEKGDAVLSSGLWAYTTTQTVLEGTTVRIEVHGDGLSGWGRLAHRRDDALNQWFPPCRVGG